MRVGDSQHLQVTPNPLTSCRLQNFANFYLQNQKRIITFVALNQAEPKRGFRGGQHGFLL
jgi:hypothetical protein